MVDFGGFAFAVEPVIMSGQDKVCIHTLANLTPMKDSFAKELYKRDDIPQKRPIILRSLLIVHANEGQGSIHTFAHTSTHSHTHIHTLSHTHTHIHTFFRSSSQAPLQMLHPEIHQITKLKFLGTNSNTTQISI